MEEQISPEAFFDSLSIAHKLDNSLDGFKLEEIQLFSYFSSFLFCYKGNASATWPHKYIAIDGYPFSDSINEAIKRHIQNGLFEDNGDYFTITGRGTDEYNTFRTQELFISREGMISAACATSILIPYNQTLRALLNEPNFKKASKLKNNDWLNQEHFYPQFKEIIDELGVATTDLVIPAVTWINLLLPKQE